MSYKSKKNRVIAHFLFFKSAESCQKYPFAAEYSIVYYAESILFTALAAEYKTITSPTCTCFCIGWTAFICFYQMILG
mgnify:CR=1 FL=1